MLPFYIVKKMVQTHQIKKLAGVMSVQKESCYNDSPNKIRKSMGLESFSLKMHHLAEQLDDKFRNYLFQIEVKVASLQIELKDEKAVSVAKVVAPPNLQLSLAKTQRECSGQLLGFQFHTTSSLETLSMFFNGLAS